MSVPLCDQPSAAPDGFVDLSTRPAFELRVGYATEQNFTGAPLPGYGWPGAWLQTAAAEALERAAMALAERDLALVVFDAYRPARASRAMVAWAERTGQTALLGTYIAPKSGHNDGGSVDVGLADRHTGALLDLGSPWDTFDETAHLANATGVFALRRGWLVEAMKAQGWQPYSKEWWHFRYAGAGKTALDVPYGACEPKNPLESR